MRITLASVCFATLAFANPVYRRQDMSSAASSAASSVSQAISSAVASDSGVGSASAPVASASASAVVYPDFPCSQGLLTYVEEQMAYPGVALSDVTSVLFNWASAVPFPITNSSGTNETGATRSYTVAGLDISEVLVNQTYDATLGNITSVANTTAPIMSGGLTIYTLNSVFQYYSNSTTGDSTGKIYANFCASEQSAGIAAVSQFFMGFLQALPSLLTSASGSMSGAMSASSMMPSGSAVASAPVLTSAVSAVSAAA